uniref:Uncharacterized protein n=1 Tax=Panagrolaimus superbus TaxID=310955 RepID=A0A914Y7L8_9BILA
MENKKQLFVIHDPPADADDLANNLGQSSSGNNRNGINQFNPIDGMIWDQEMAEDEYTPPNKDGSEVFEGNNKNMPGPSYDPEPRHFTFAEGSRLHGMRSDSAYRRYVVSVF